MIRKPPPATAVEIREIVGAIDDAVLLRIEETGATAAEVLEAFAWLTSDDQIGTELERGPRSTVLQVYDILRADEAEPDAGR
jgi:hypothetical protein